MLDWQRVLSLIVAITIVVMVFLSLARVEHFWAVILLYIIPTILALISIWFGDEVDDWFGNPAALPRWVYRLVGWLVLAIEAVHTFISWRVVAPYLTK